MAWLDARLPAAMPTAAAVAAFGPRRGAVACDTLR
jgi:hypothetical protein